MTTYIVILELSDDGGVLTAAEALAEHNRLLEQLAEYAALQLSSTAFLIQTDDEGSHVLSSLTPFLDRDELIYVFEAELDGWNALTTTDIIQAVDKMTSA